MMQITTRARAVEIAQTIVDAMLVGEHVDLSKGVEFSKLDAYHVSTNGGTMSTIDIGMLVLFPLRGQIEDAAFDVLSKLMQQRRAERV